MSLHFSSVIQGSASKVAIPIMALTHSTISFYEQGNGSGNCEGSTDNVLFEAILNTDIVFNNRGILSFFDRDLSKTLLMLRPAWSIISTNISSNFICTSLASYFLRFLKEAWKCLNRGLGLLHRVFRYSQFPPAFAILFRKRFNDVSSEMWIFIKLSLLLQQLLP